MRCLSAYFQGGSPCGGIEKRRRIGVKQTEISSERNSSTDAQNLEPWTNPTVVGKPLPRVDGYERVSGSAIYPADLILPDMLHAAILRCPHPHAIVKNLNTEAAVLVEETYETSCEIDATVETHVAVARWEGEQLTVWVPTQAIYEEQKSLAATLRLPVSSVRVISQYVGGSFGCKAELSKHTLIAALLARKTRRPVKLALSREESFLCAGNRPPNVMCLKAGAKKDGSLTALEFTNLGAVGAYADWADAAGWAAGSYACSNIRTQDTEVYINAGKARAFRGPGAAQSAWALEQMIDMVADKIGMDPVEFRLKNVPATHPRTGEPYTSIELRECLLKGAEAFGWTKARAARASSSDPVKRGVGVASCRWITEGGPPTTVIVTLFPDGSATLNMAAADQGTGTKT